MCLAAILVLAGLSLSDEISAQAEWFTWGRTVPSATAARLGGNTVRTRFVADLTVAVHFNAYVISDPYRVVIDLEEVSFNLPPNTGKSGRGLINSFRYGLVDAGRSRIVMDVAGPVMIEKAFILQPEHGEPARIVVDLLPTDEKTFAKLQREQQQQLTGSTGPEPAPALSTDALKAPERSVSPSDLGGKSKSEATAALTSPDPLANPPLARTNGRRTIVIDPGHGGIDPGAVGKDGVTEKSIALAFAKELEKQLDPERYKVVLTRRGDTFLSLKDRVRIARQNQADLFLAIHADVFRGSKVRGATVYTLSDTASDAEAEALVQQENRSDLIGGVQLSEENEEITGILIDLAQRETKNHSMVFARSMVETLKPVIEMTTRPVRSGGFRVLKAPDVPSVLLELGYLSSRADKQLLSSPAWRRKASTAVAQAIDNYFSSTVAAAQ
jgi:N-acetylmuramoyl-L-alanine amidase